MTWDKENAETDCNVMSVTCDENWLETVLCGLFFSMFVWEVVWFLLLECLEMNPGLCLH